MSKLSKAFMIGLVYSTPKIFITALCIQLAIYYALYLFAPINVVIGFIIFDVVSTIFIYSYTYYPKRKRNIEN